MLRRCPNCLAFDTISSVENQTVHPDSILVHINNRKLAVHGVTVMVCGACGTTLTVYAGLDRLGSLLREKAERGDPDPLEATFEPDENGWS